MLPLSQPGRRRTTWIVVGSATLALAAALVGVGCCQRQAERGATTPPSTEPSLCATLRGAPAPELRAPPALEPPDSRVTLDVRITTERLKREIASRVPVTLARERGRPIGAPGRVSYVVKRGAIGVSLDGTNLVVTTPISVHAEVCKPIGPICATYGRCDPKLQARATMPLALSEDYELGQSQVSVQVTEPCVIMAFDATGQIQKIATQQAAQVKRKIDRALPPVRPQVDAVWQRLRRPMALPSGQCLQVTPDRVVQSHPTLTDRMLSVRFAASGRLTLLPQCAEPPLETRQRHLPPLGTEPSLPDGSTLRLALSRSWAQATEQLNASIDDAREHEQPSVHPIHGPVRLHPTLVGESPRVAVEVALGGAECGTLWLVGEAGYDATQQRIRMRELAPLHQGLGTLAADQARAIAQHIERSGWLPAPEALATAKERLERLARHLRDQAPDDADVQVDLGSPRIDRVVPTADAMVAIATIEAKLGGGAK